MALAPAAKLELSTPDLAEAIAAVSKVYCPHEVKILGSNRGVRTNLAALERPRHSIVSLRYSAPVHIDAGNFDDLMLMMTCTDGSARAPKAVTRSNGSVGRHCHFRPMCAVISLSSATFASTQCGSILTPWRRCARGY